MRIVCHQPISEWRASPVTVADDQLGNSCNRLTSVRLPGALAFAAYARAAATALCPRRGVLGGTAAAGRRQLRALSLARSPMRDRRFELRCFKSVELKPALKTNVCACSRITKHIHYYYLQKQIQSADT